MEEPRSTRHLKRAEVAGASTAPTAPTAPKRRRIACVGEAPLELRSEEHEVAPPLLLPYPDSPEKVSAPSEAGDFVSSSSSSSGPSEPPRSSGRSDEDSVDVVKEKKFDMVGDDRQQQAKSCETEASTCNRDFRRNHSAERAEAFRGGDAVARGAGIVLLGGGGARAAAVRGEVQLRRRHGRPPRRPLRVDPLEAVSRKRERRRRRGDDARVTPGQLVATSTERERERNEDG
ncbi:hypothetical protein EUGRSUZ_G01464 [Eucalyptus grandis]|uniref:Uncharacterized protein n=2 Tax=Eucalyptus grandis TaxID=71139 RepID=A0ACC3K2B2_EUCGR|nr:hypothetical protein EUGRSUZ_G01464 [Eucalyptus grandis]